MTNKEMLQKRIDALCEELGINEPQYTDKTTEKQLNGIIDELEAKLPDEGDENDDIDSTIEHNLDADSSEETTEGNATTGKVPSEKNVLVMAGDLHEDVALINDDETVEVVSDESCDVLVFALKTFECISHGRRITVKQGGEEYLEEQAAIDAIEANVAAFRAQLKG
ncbi:hypothetical protein [Vibrio vulnificus]|uniref:hypothetical protein n=1 Tax=Vibrio vulnificus TaxID=672 RepID=UPI000D3EE216|nr:hypothetical protein [Vibrio vulnificus]MBN8108650.1 hypothetical protein [Vibrio vulnificus]PUZ89441.1 hypothetical protein DC360_04405 [Vibrio vulnificus]